MFSAEIGGSGKSAECCLSAVKGVVPSLHVRVEKTLINRNNDEENELAYF